jgi:DMSO/TMAO reductase YedYZ molybdopterin-dependent catalytic subunit
MNRHFRTEHVDLTRRYFIGLGTVGACAFSFLPNLYAAEQPIAGKSKALDKAISKLDYLTHQLDFSDVSRGNPVPHSLNPQQQKEAGLTRETWQLEVLADPDNKADITNPMTKENGNAFDFKTLSQLAKKRTVSFPKIMTCNNIGAPLGMGIWEGVPLRDVIWLTAPKKNLRRVFYHGFHNNDPKQMFRSSLPIGRVLEDPFGLPPVILCFKLNGQPLHPERGGPVRMLVPEAYGFKSVKWLTRIYLSNLAHANDTYAKANNDVDSWLKTFASTISIGKGVKAGQPIPVTGYCQVGISGLSKVQYWIQPKGKPWPANDPYFLKAPWKDAQVLGPPTTWGGELPDDTIPSHTVGFDPKTRKPKKWPMRLAKAHWAALVPGLPEGEYVFRCRSIDANSIAQPLPRPFRKSGRNALGGWPFVING